MQQPKVPILLVLTSLLWLEWRCQASELRVRPESAHDLIVTSIDDAWQFETTGTDPYVTTELIAPLSDQTHVLDFDYICVETIKAPSLYFGPPITAMSLIDLPSMRQAEGWYRYTADLQKQYGQDLPLSTRVLRIDFGSKAGLTIRVRNLRLRERTIDELNAIAKSEENELVKSQYAQRIKSYIEASAPSLIQTVHIDNESLDIATSLATSDMPFKLLEFPIDQSLGDDSRQLQVDFTREVVDGNLHLHLPRRVDGRDRLNSRFAIGLAQNGSEILSQKRFVTSFQSQAPAIPALRKPVNQKGLSEFSRRGPESDLVELGISAVTLNLVLNHFLSDHEGIKQERIPVPGVPIYFNHYAFVGIDDLTMLARKHHLVISAILLIVNSETAQPGSPLLHPEVDGGVYAMPDLTSARGTAIYSFVLDKIAERYRDPTSDLGGITNWIAHNEVDFHSVWTNLGKQPRAIATETYYRSMRMIHNAARSYQPDARVFASLTHHWVQPDDGSGRQLSPREVIETLQRLSSIEGDFQWGVAYHPYPESLFANVAWEDKLPTDSFDTPLITIQNLPVLARFLEQPSMRDSHGKMRPVILSEQGFHTADNSEGIQRKQADSLAYAMKQVRSLPIVESFHYHRWLDHPDEGGLNLGLRTQPTSSEPFGTKKQSWETYRREANGKDVSESRDSK